MARRRRQKNPLLPRIFAIAVMVNVVAVLIAAQFGAFKAIQKQFGDAKVVLLKPAEAPKEKSKPVEKKARPKSQTSRKAQERSTKSSSTAHPKASAPQVVASGASSADGPGGPVVDQGTLRGGELPATKAPEPAKPEEKTTTQPSPQPQPEPKPEVRPEPKPEPKPAKPEPKPEPKFIECEAISQPQPAIPDDLRAEELSKDFVAEAVVGTDGVPKSLKTSQSTGIDELDRVALEAAKKWRFTPATLGGAPTEQTVLIKIQFRVQ
jgi:protein TonB